MSSIQPDALVSTVGWCRWVNTVEERRQCRWHHHPCCSAWGEGRRCWRGRWWRGRGRLWGRQLQEEQRDIFFQSKSSWVGQLIVHVSECAKFCCQYQNSQSESLLWSISLLLSLLLSLSNNRLTSFTRLISFTSLLFSFGQVPVRLMTILCKRVNWGENLGNCCIFFIFCPEDGAPLDQEGGHNAPFS